MADLCAWIIAIERYTAGPEGPSELDIASPIASSALKLARRLRERDPNVRLLLNLSLPVRDSDADDLDKLVAQGIEPLKSDQSGLQANLEKAGGGDALLLYWVGHGVLREGQRLALTAESERADKLHAIDLMSVLNHLRAQTRAPLQFGFVDICGQIIGTEPTLLKLPGGDGTNAQHFYFSASAGELASSATERSGFTQSVLATLDAQPWPPEPKALHDDLMQRLDSLPAAESRWTELHYTMGSSDLVSHRKWRAGENPADAELRREADRAQLTPTALQHLMADVGKVFKLAEVASAVRDRTLPALIEERRAAAAPQAAEPTLLADAWARVEVVRDLLPDCEALGLFLRPWLNAVAELQGIDGADTGAANAPSLEALLLATLSGPHAERRRLALARLLTIAARKASRSRPLQSQALLTALAGHPTLGAHAAEAARTVPAEDERSYLQASLRLDEATQRAVVDAAYLHDAGHAVPVEVPDATDGLAAQLNSLIQDLAERVAPRQLVVELLAPLNLLCAPRDWLRFEHVALGVPIWLEENWPVTVRLRERLLPGMAKVYQSAQWRQRHAEARARLIGRNRLSWSRQGALPTGDVIGLSFPGPSPTDPQRNREDFVKALLAGHPYMCWPRDNVADVDAYEKAARELVEAHGLPTLASALRDAKAQAALRELMLLIDEPDRNPLAPAGAGPPPPAKGAR